MNGPARVLHLAVDRIGVDALLDHAVLAGERIVLRTSNTTTAWHARPIDADHAHLAADGARHLVERGVVAVGIDHVRIGCPHRDDLEVQEELSAAGVPVVTGLLLDEVEAGGYELRCHPLSPPGGRGTPARVLLRRRDAADAARPGEGTATDREQPWGPRPGRPEQRAFRDVPPEHVLPALPS